MDSAELYESLRDEDDKNEEMADAAAFFIGLKKEAYYSPPFSMGGDSAKGWISQFEGSPLLQQALALERQELQMEAEDLTKRQQERAESDGRIQADQQRWDMRDQLRIQKRQLELQAAEQALGGIEEGALPKHEAGMTTADVAPAEGGAEPPATVPGTGLPKMAGAAIQAVKHIGKRTGRGALIGGAIGGVAPIPLSLLSGGTSSNGKRKTIGEKFKSGIKEMPGTALLGAGIGSSFGLGHGAAEVAINEMEKRELKKTLQHLKTTKDHISRVWPNHVSGKLKNAMMKLGFSKTAGALEVASKVIKHKAFVPAVGGTLGALSFYRGSKPREELGGKSRDEIESARDLKISRMEKPEKELGFTGKIDRRLDESKIGLSKTLREHPIRAALLGAGVGAYTGQQLKSIMGIGSEHVNRFLQARKQLKLPGIR
jgi:hypothetical protein